MSLVVYHTKRIYLFIILNGYNCLSYQNSPVVSYQKGPVVNQNKMDSFSYQMNLVVFYIKRFSWLSDQKGLLCYMSPVVCHAKKGLDFCYNNMGLVVYHTKRIFRLHAYKTSRTWYLLKNNESLGSGGIRWKFPTCVTPNNCLRQMNFLNFTTT